MKAVSEKVIQQTPDPIERPPGGGDPATEPDAAAVGADTVNKAAATAPKKIFVCSPYRPTSKTEECRKDELMVNINRAKTACRILTTLGFLPLAPHLYFTQFLKDEDAQERNTGMKLGMRWLEEAVQPETEKSEAVPQGGQVKTVPINIHIDNLHIHMDERMTSYNNFEGDSDETDEPDEDEPEDIDVDAMIGLIKARTGLCEKVILAVLAAQEEYLDSIWGENMDEVDKA